MNMFKTLKTILVVGLMPMLVSCGSWLDVKPDDRIMGDELYKDKDGYMVALNGIYSELNRPSLYGANLTMGMIDVLGQYYNCNVTGHTFRQYMNYGYEQEECKNAIDAIWTEMYELIANCNSILEQCGDGTPVLPEDYYRMIKGECLALRAMMHFDLLRMFGPVWDETGKTTECIPYMIHADKTVQPLLKAEKVLELVISDLKEAERLLETMDPVITKGNEVPESIVGSKDMEYRPYRLNYFAVKALLARVYLWGGDKQNAGQQAREVLAAVTNETKPLFPLADAAYTNTWSSDFVFSPEVIFGLHNTSRMENVYNTFFAPSLNADRMLTLAGDYASGRFKNAYTDENDIRRRMWNEAVNDGVSFVCLNKFKQANTFRFSYLIPLIRTSEMYLIAAECETDVQKALDQYLNPLRLARRCVNLDAVDEKELNQHIQWEYYRELIGEGQMFFYYKRKMMQNIPDGGHVSNNRNMALKDYVFPLPDSEISQRAEN